MIDIREINKRIKIGLVGIFTNLCLTVYSILAMHNRIITKKNNNDEFSETINKLHINNNPSSQVIRNSLITAGSSIAAGGVISYATFPLEAIKKLFETGKLNYKQIFSYISARKMSPIRVFNDSWQNGYLKYLYRGSFAFALNVVPTTGIQFTTEERLKFYIPDNSHANNIIRNIFSGMLGASTAVIVENVVVRQQLLDKGLRFTFTNDILSQGYARPWKSYPLIAARDAIFAICMFSALPEAKKKFANHDLLSWLGVSTLGTLLSHPADMIATQLQKTHDRTSYLQICKNIYAKDGIKGFYKGASQRFFLFSAFTNFIPSLESKFKDNINTMINNDIEITRPRM